jgi:uncharacterized membrane protein YphA (DoxX/SURF4 family)
MRLEPGSWSPWKRFGFRFLFAYAVLTILPFPLGSVPWTEAISAAHTAACQEAAQWVGRQIIGLGADVPATESGSGDRTIDYLLALTFVLIAAATAIVWSAVDRRRTSHPRLLGALHVYVRYYLAFVLLDYGFAKVLKTQFPFPPLAKLVQPYGSSSPMGLLWTFMGYSTTYTVFAGALEVLGGALLFFRRTTTLGALVTIGVMSNVVMLNFSYDVPVKLYSTHLLLMAVFLAAPDLRRVLDLFVRNRAVPAAPLEPHFAGRARRRLALAAKILAVGLALFVSVSTSLTYRAAITASDPLLGLYEVDEFARNGHDVQALLGNSSRWRWVSLESWGARVMLLDDTMLRFSVTYDHEQHEIELQDWFGPGTTHVFSTENDGDHLVLEGTMGFDTIRAELRKVDPSRFPLVSRGFHWINEVPFNR